MGTPQPSEVPLPVEAQTPDHHQEHRLRVLVVEDDRDTADSTAVLLRLSGHTAEIAADGQTALKVAAVNPPDVVLLDLGLPGMDGWEVARRLREQQGDKAHRVPLIAVTGYGQPVDRQRSRDAGVTLHLVKPVDPELLCRILASYPKTEATG